MREVTRASSTPERRPRTWLSAPTFRAALMQVLFHVTRETVVQHLARCVLVRPAFRAGAHPRTPDAGPGSPARVLAVFAATVRSG